MKVLALNWRDPGHPEAGGAEVHIWEILTRWVKRGAQITYLSSSFPGAASQEQLDGIKILRRGSWWNANWAAARAVRGELKNETFDLVLEDLNKLPYYSPLYAPAPVLTVVPHLFGTTVFSEASWPVGAVVWGHESLIPLVYGKGSFLVISDSTREDLVKRGIRRDQVSVSYCGIDHERYHPGGKKTEVPSIVFLGRLRKYKGVDILLEAFARLRKDVPQATLAIVGDGPHRVELERHASRIGLGNDIEFAGFVSAEEKLSRLQSAWVTALPSPKEGWGLTVIEGNACGTPVVASRSPGLTDSVREGETGLLVPHGDRGAFAEALGRLLKDSDLRDRMAANGLVWASRFTWERTADEAWQVAQSVIRGERPPDFSMTENGPGIGVIDSNNQRTA